MYKSSEVRIYSCWYEITLDVQVKLSAKNVIDRGLVTDSPKSKDILKEHKSYCDVEREVKHFSGQTLAYVTPVSDSYLWGTTSWMELQA